ncbi:MAG: OmpA family protein [Nitrospira sp.]|nr:OmpA family protein [Nitrospira sp.]
MIIKLSTLPLVSVAVLCGNVLVSTAAVQPSAVNPSVEFSRKPAGQFAPQTFSVREDTARQNKRSLPSQAANSGEERKARPDRLQQQLAAKEAELSSLHDKILVVNELLNMEKQRAGSLETQLIQKELELKALREREDPENQASKDSDLTKPRLQPAKQRSADVERQVAAGNLENAKRRVGELILELHAKDSEIRDLRSVIHENSKKARADLAAQTEEFNSAKHRLAEAEQQIAGNKQASAESKRRLAEGEGQIAAGNEQELAQTKRLLTEAEQRIAGNEQALAESKRRLAEGEQQIAGREQELVQTKRLLAEAEQRIAGNEQALAESKRRLAEGEQQIAGREQELVQTKRRLAEAEQRIAGNEQVLAESKRRLTEGEQQTAAGNEQELAQTKRHLAEVELQMAGKEQELAQAKDELKQVSQKLDELNLELTTRTEELAQTKQLFAKLEDNLAKVVKPSTSAENAPIYIDEMNQRLVEVDLPLQGRPQRSSMAPASTDEAEALSNDFGKLSRSLGSLLQPELARGGAALRERGNKLILTFGLGGLFASGEATMTLGGNSLLERVGTVLRGFRYQSIEVVGHTDNVPVRNASGKGVSDNMELSQIRAERVSQALINGGVGADRVKVVGYGDTRPIATNDNERGRMKNRRVEIVIASYPSSVSDSTAAPPRSDKKSKMLSTEKVVNR